MYLIPMPKKWDRREGELALPYLGQIIIEASCSQSIYEYAKLCSQAIYEGTGFTYEIRRGTGTGPVFLKQDQNLKREAYQLDISEQGILICGKDDSGILYGIQTLRQLVMQQGAILSCMQIEDAPVMSNRGYFHDVSRGRVPTLAWLKELADMLCFYKMNQLQLYVEHSFLFTGFSEVWRDDTPLTADEIMEFDDYCEKRGIELIPSLASFGHLYKLLAAKSFCHLCEYEGSEAYPFSFKDRMDHHTIDITNEESFALIRRMILEYMPLFRSRKFNICADETFDLGKGRSRARAEQEGIAEMYTGFLSRLCTLVVAKGHIPMFWGDIMLKFPELIKRLPQETICLNWGYSMNEKEDATRIYAQAGVNQYVCPGVAGWNQLINRLEPSFLNITKMCRYGITYGAGGMLNTDWGDYGHINHPAFSIPGLIYGAYAAWNLQELSFEEINQGISVLHYRDSSGNFLAAIERISAQDCFNWQAMVRFKEWYPQPAKKQKSIELILELQESISQAGTNNRNVDQAVRQLSDCIKSMDSKTKETAREYLMAAAGIKIKNEIGWVLLQYVKGQPLPQKLWPLAEELEAWYLQYRRLWHSISKESELYRISQVIFWYADFLRELAQSQEEKGE